MLPYPNEFISHALMACVRGGVLIDISDPVKKSWFKPFPNMMDLAIGKKRYTESYSKNIG
jgi:hypothetical protein